VKLFSYHAFLDNKHSYANEVPFGSPILMYEKWVKLLAESDVNILYFLKGGVCEA
jgi:hypothetical protein